MAVVTTRVVKIDADILERADEWAAARYAHAWPPLRSDILGALIELGHCLYVGPAPARRHRTRDVRIDATAVLLAGEHARIYQTTIGRAATWLLSNGLQHAEDHYRPVIDPLKP